MFADQGSNSSQYFKHIASRLILYAEKVLLLVLQIQFVVRIRLKMFTVHGAAGV